ncbi:unnamed protein product [Brassica napus]|uniref:(rape) hypothetical protein n=1 Tax=Brassica napus TaxID=3708 RepID=A0A816QWU9_BRANA|nr:unnamed protein product [Brassica napus]
MSLVIYVFLIHHGLVNIFCIVLLKYMFNSSRSVEVFVNIFCIVLLKYLFNLSRFVEVFFWDRCQNFPLPLVRRREEVFFIYKDILLIPNQINILLMNKLISSI